MGTRLKKFGFGVAGGGMVAATILLLGASPQAATANPGEELECDESHPTCSCFGVPELTVLWCEGFEFNVGERACDGDGDCQES